MADQDGTATIEGPSADIMMFQRDDILAANNVTFSFVFAEHISENVRQGEHTAPVSRSYVVCGQGHAHRPFEYLFATLIM